MARPKGSKNLPKEVPVYTEQDVRDLNNKLDKTVNLAEQARDQITDLMAENDFYRKQVNHLLALVNILSKGK